MIIEVNFYGLMKQIPYSISGNLWSNLIFTDASKTKVNIPDNTIIDLKKLLYNEPQTNFTTKLLQAILKADNENLHKLSIVYPEEVFVVWCFHNLDGFAQKYLEGNNNCYYCEGKKSQRLISNGYTCCPECKRNF